MCRLTLEHTTHQLHTDRQADRQAGRQAGRPYSVQAVQQLEEEQQPLLASLCPGPAHTPAQCASATPCAPPSSAATASSCRQEKEQNLMSTRVSLHPQLHLQPQYLRLTLGAGGLVHGSERHVGVRSEPHQHLVHAPH